MKNRPSYRTATGKTKKKYLLLRLWKYMSRYRLLIVCAAVLMLVSNIFALLGPKI